MKKNEPKVFLQTRSTTCSIACMMMILNHIFDSPLTVGEETILWRRLRMRGYQIVPSIDIALYMKEHGLDVSVRHDNPQRFWIVISNTMSDDFVERMRYRHEIALRHGLRIVPGTVTKDEIVKKLTDDALLIFGIDLNGIKHAILICGLEGEYVTVIDPLVGRSVELLDRVILRVKMDVGTWYISAQRRNKPDTPNEN